MSIHEHLIGDKGASQPAIPQAWSSMRSYNSARQHSGAGKTLEKGGDEPEPIRTTVHESILRVPLTDLSAFLTDRTACRQ